MIDHPRTESNLGDGVVATEEEVEVIVAEDGVEGEVVTKIVATRMMEILILNPHEIMPPHQTLGVFNRLPSHHINNRLKPLQ
jgi:hypothetical protein